MVYLFIAFIVVPVIEIFLITQLASQLSWPLAIVLVIGVSMVGALLVSREGPSAIRRVREALRSGQVPTNELADGAMVFFASALMLTPGFITDFIGLALLIPPIRALLRPPVITFFKKRLEIKAQDIGVGALFTSQTGRGFEGGVFGGMPMPGAGRDVYDTSARPTPQDADLTDIPPEPPELST